MSDSVSKRRRLKDLLRSGKTLAAPAVYDCIGAKIGEQAGFEFLFTGGFGIAASLYGLPDLGYLTSTEMLDAARRIAKSVNIPVIADMDTGYGGPLNIIRLVQEAIDADIGGIILEDQEWPKRCGHLRGKRVVEAEEYLEKLTAADYARRGADFTIVARTDALSVHGLDEALRRGKMYLEAGADILFVEAPGSVDELQRIAEHFRDATLLANIIEGGKTPELSVQELGSMGYRVIAFALTGLLSTSEALMNTFTSLLKEGRPGKGDFTFEDIKELLHVEGHILLSERFSSKKD